MPAIKHLRPQAWPVPTGFAPAGLSLNLTTLVPWAVALN